MKENIKFKIVLVLFLTILTCCKNGKQFCGENIWNLTVVNKAPACFEGLTHNNLSQKESKHICEELNKLQMPLEDVYVGFNYGILEVKNNQKVVFLVVFSEYNGTILRYNGEYYKNDDLFKLIKNSLRLKLKTDKINECKQFDLLAY